MQKPAYWNHNVSCFGWVRRHTARCRSILDVGCGDGSLLRYLDDGEKQLAGGDADPGCIRMARTQSSERISFFCSEFSVFSAGQTYDALVFVASLHHMPLIETLERAKALLNPGGRILIVGLARPSAPLDYIAEALRVIPSAVISRIRCMKTTEENQIPVSYEFPAMSEIRALKKTVLPGAVIRYALHYRYLLEWKKL